MLTKMGYHHSGNEIMYNGFTGEQIYSEIYMGPTYYMRLKHMVKDKINYRATGKRNFLTRQTNQGRANDGGLKIGEMERDGILAHGISYFLNESYMVRGDQYYMAVCNKTGTIAVYNPDKNLFLSPFADGPLVFNKNVEGEYILDAISKFGRSFSLIRVPFALKLLIQELQVMNIQMRIITEDNVDQLMNLSYQSRNIDKLLQIDHGEDGTVERDIKEIIANYKKDIETKMRTVDVEKRRYTRNNDKLKQVLQQQEEEILNSQPGKYKNVWDTIDDDPEMQMMTAEQRAYYINLVNGTEPHPINLFQNDEMNEAFILLDPEKQKRMLRMEPTLRRIIMKESMLRNANQLQIPSQQKEQQIPLVQPISVDVSPDYPPYTPYDPNSPNYSPSYNPYVHNPPNGGSINVFPGDPNMNAVFNMLNGEKQARILQMEPELRQIVMKQIMYKNGKQTNNVQAQQPQSGGGELQHYFNTLPANKKLEALKGAYNSMSTDFSKLANKVSNPLTTIIKPVSMQEQLTDSLPLLSVETKDKIKDDLDKDTTDTSSKSVSFSSSTDTSDSSSNGGSTKKITIN
jgi:hypothetical protein